MVNRRRRRRAPRLRNRRGMTLIEVMISVLMLAVGVLALVGTSAATTRMLSRGNRAVKSAFYSQEQLEILMATPCANLVAGSASRQTVFNSSWIVTDAPGGMSKRVRFISTYPGPFRTTRTDTTEISVLCIR